MPFPRSWWPPLPLANRPPKRRVRFDPFALSLWKGPRSLRAILSSVQPHPSPALYTYLDGFEAESPA